MKEHPFAHFASQLLSGLLPLKGPVSLAAGYYLDYIGASASTVITLLAFIFFDLVFGYWLAVREERVSSRELFRWVQKVLVYFFAIFLCGHAIQSFFDPMGWDWPLLDIVMSAMIFTETGSILRHMEDLGFKVPRIIVWVIHALDKRVRREVEKVLEGGEGGESDDRNDRKTDSDGSAG
jgi:toxin secretion/phage lysis holin